MDGLDALWQPIKIGGLELPNRVVASAHGAGLTGEPYAEYVGALARGGAGLIVSFATMVHRSSDIGPSVRGWEPAVVDHFRLATEAVHAAGRPLIVQIFHIGVQHPGMGTVEHRGLLWSPSGDPSPVFDTTPKAIEREEIA